MDSKFFSFMKNSNYLIAFDRNGYIWYFSIKGLKLISKTKLRREYFQHEYIKWIN